MITTGTVLFFVFEYGNPATMGELNFGQRLLASLFQSVTTRTAGFNTIGQADMTEQSQVLTMILMAIGGSPGSTAGGIKTTTFALLLIAMVYTLRGQERYSIFGRNIAVRQVISALTIIMSFGATILATSLLMSSYQGLPFMDILFENISAAGTVGLSFGVTSQMFPLSQVILIFLMFFGRIGILTLSIALMTRNDAGTNIKFPEGKVIVG